MARNHWLIVLHEQKFVEFNEDVLDPCQSLVTGLCMDNVLPEAVAELEKQF